MTKYCYVIDTSSLIELNRINPIDIYPSVWEKLSLLVKNNRLIAPIEVYNEIIKKDDLLVKWIKKNKKKMFIEPTEKQINIVKEILSEFPSLINLNREYSADPWVIALAIEKSKERTLVKIKWLVVTQEKMRGNRVKIPFVSKKFDIESIDIMEMFRFEKWKF